MTEKRVMKLASRGKRFGAACIDAFVPFVSYLMVSAVLAANGINMNYPGYGYGFGNSFGYGYGFGYGYRIGSGRLSGASAAIMVTVFFILLAYIAAQFVLYSKGKTIGKAMIGMQVVSSNDGKPFGFWKMLFRELFVKSASASVFCLGFIWILIDEKNRSWHDKILDTYVVDLKESEKINYRRQLEQVRKAEPAAETAPAPVNRRAEPVTPETKPVEEPGIEITPEVKSVEEPVTDADPETQPADGPSDELTDELSPAESPDDELMPEEAEAAAEASAEEFAADADGEAAAFAEETAQGFSMAMKKEDLLEAARERGVQVSSRSTKAAIIEALEKAAAENDTEE